MISCPSVCLIGAACASKKSIAIQVCSPVKSFSFQSHRHMSKKEHDAPSGPFYRGKVSVRSTLYGRRPNHRHTEQTCSVPTGIYSLQYLFCRILHHNASHKVLPFVFILCFALPLKSTPSRRHCQAFCWARHARAMPVRTGSPVPEACGPWIRHVSPSALPALLYSAI